MCFSLRGICLVSYLTVATGAVFLLPGGSSLAQETSFRMPEYPDNHDPPPPRTKAEVEKLLSGAKENPEEPSVPMHVLLVSGPKDHGKGEHDYPNWLKVWERMVPLSENTTVDTAYEFPTQEQVDKADVMVFYQRGRWDAERAAVIDPFLARGGGLVYIHWAIDGRGGEHEMAKRIGLASLGGGIKYRHGPLELDFTHDPDHPIMRNFDHVNWVDESYWQLRGDPSKLHLLGTGMEDGEPQPLFWTFEYGRGRVFVSVPGHYMWTFDDPTFRTLLLRGIAWAGRRDVDRFNKLVTLDARVE
jgi:type 1 glutamine amidotransferase